MPSTHAHSMASTLSLSGLTQLMASFNYHTCSFTTIHLTSLEEPDSHTCSPTVCARASTAACLHTYALLTFRWAVSVWLSQVGSLTSLSWQAGSKSKKQMRMAPVTLKQTILDQSLQLLPFQLLRQWRWNSQKKSLAIIQKILWIRCNSLDMSRLRSPFSSLIIFFAHRAFFRAFFVLRYLRPRLLRPAHCVILYSTYTLLDTRVHCPAPSLLHAQFKETAKRVAVEESKHLFYPKNSFTWNRIDQLWVAMATFKMPGE